MTEETAIDADILGADRSLLETIRLLRAEGVSPHVIVPRSGRFVEELEREAIPYTVWPHYWWIGRKTEPLHMRIARYGALLLTWLGSPLLARRLANLMAGLVLFGTGLAMMLNARLGVPPWDVLHQGLYRQFGLTIGTWSIIVSVLVLALWIPLKERFGIGTILNAVLVGVFLDLYDLIGIVPELSNLPLGIAVMVAGLFAMSLGQYFYMTAALGCGPRDTLFVGLGKRFPKIPIGAVNTAVMAAALLGWTGVALWLGRQLFRAFHVRSSASIVQMIVGIILITLMSRLPWCLGWLSGLIFASWGLGAVVTTRFGTQAVAGAEPGRRPYRPIEVEDLPELLPPAWDDLAPEDDASIAVDAPDDAPPLDPEPEGSGGGGDGEGGDDQPGDGEGGDDPPAS